MPTPTRRRSLESEDSAQTQGTAKKPHIVQSCAECRRLKVKCDRRIPCQRCVKRGLSELCPGEALGDSREM